MGSLIRNRPSRYEGTAVASGHAHSPRRLVRHGGRTGSGRFVAGEVLIREKPRPESNRRGDSICCRLGVLSIPLSARGARARAGDAVESHGQRKSTTERALLSEWISKALIRAIWVGVRGLEPRTSSLSVMIRQCPTLCGPLLTGNASLPASMDVRTCPPVLQYGKAVHQRGET